MITIYVLYKNINTQQLGKNERTECNDVFSITYSYLCLFSLQKKPYFTKQILIFIFACNTNIHTKQLTAAQA